MLKTVTLVTFVLFGIDLCSRPLVDEVTTGESVDYIRTAINVWDFFIFETRDDSVGIIFTDPKTLQPQSVIY